jgi:hypothetical protein
VSADDMAALAATLTADGILQALSDLRETGRWVERAQARAAAEGATLAGASA